MRGRLLAGRLREKLQDQKPGPPELLSFGVAASSQAPRGSTAVILRQIYPGSSNR